MLTSSNDLSQFAVEATDGQTGHCEDFYFDDSDWRIRYLVTQSGFLFNSRQSLIKSTLLGMPDVEHRRMRVSLTKEQIESAEKPETHPPVSEQRMSDIRQRQFEHWPPLMLGVPGAAYTPFIAEDQLRGDVEAGEEVPGDPHLRSIAEVTGYSVAARDGEIGSISDFLLDPDTWTVKFLVADTGTWIPGRQVVAKTDWISKINWSERTVTVDVMKADVEGAPELSQVEELERSDNLLTLAPYGVFGP